MHATLPPRNLLVSTAYRHIRDCEGAANKAATRSTSVASGKETNGTYFPMQVLVTFDENMRALYHTHVRA